MTKKEMAELKAATRAIRDNWFEMVEGVQQRARLLRVKYNTLIEEGFSQQEAMEIIKARGLVD